MNFISWAWALHGFLKDALLLTFGAGQDGGGEVEGAAVQPAEHDPQPAVEHNVLEPPRPVDQGEHDIEMMRAVKDQSLRTATEFLQSGSWQDLYMLRVALHGQTQLKTAVCSSVSEEAELRAMEARLVGRAAKSRVEKVASGKLTQPMFEHAMTAVQNEDYWRHLPFH